MLPLKKWLHLQLQIKDKYVTRYSFLEYYNVLLKQFRGDISRHFFLYEGIKDNPHIYLAFETDKPKELFIKIKKITPPKDFNGLIRIKNSEDMPVSFLNMLWLGSIYAIREISNDKGYYGYDKYKLVHCLLNQMGHQQSDERDFYLNALIMRHWGNVPSEIKGYLGT